MPEHPKRRKTYSQEFKRRAVSLHLERGKSVRSVSRPAPQGITTCGVCELLELDSNLAGLTDETPQGMLTNP